MARRYMVLRIVAAVVGGFGLTNLAVLVSAGLLARLGVAGSEAVVAAAMAGFLVYLALLLWGLACDSLRRLCIGLSVPAVVLAAVWRWVL